MISKHVKDFVTSFTIKDIRLRKTDNSDCREDQDTSGTFYTAGGSGKCYKHFGKPYCSFLILFIYFSPMNQQFPFQVFTQEKLKNYIPQKPCTRMFKPYS